MSSLPQLISHDCIYLVQPLVSIMKSGLHTVTQLFRCFSDAEIKWGQSWHLIDS